jgi:HAD superfamily hydrolase (TIGR01509 family)
MGSVHANPRAVIFDLDGTLVDSFDLVVLAFAKACRDYLGRDLSREEVISRFGVTEVQMLRRELPESLHEKAIATFRQCYAANHRQMVKVFEGILEMLDALRQQRIPMGVMTAKGRDTADITLRELGWTHFFGTVITGDEATRTKPAPDGPLQVAAELGVSPGDCIFVGDAPADIGAGKAAGMKTVWASWHPVYQVEVLKLRPDVIAQHPRDICGMFD